jgi:hypothetical protein
MSNRRPKTASIDPFKIFVHAHQFFYAQEFIYENTENDRESAAQLAIPANTLSAFASELVRSARSRH